MQWSTRPLWAPRFAAAAVAAVFGASGVYWTLQWPGSSADLTTGLLTDTATPAEAAPDVRGIAHLLGAGASVRTPLALSAGQRFELTGLVASDSGKGAALIAIDGAQPRAYSVGAKIDGGLLLESVNAKGAVLIPASDGTGRPRMNLPVSSK
jgi:general secretion pathway protein C